MRLVFAPLLGSLWMVIACSDGEVTGPESERDGPGSNAAVPSVQGTWRMADVTGVEFGIRLWWAMDLEQDGSVITGETRFGKEDFSLTGSITTFGRRPITGSVTADSVLTLLFDNDSNEGVDTVAVKVISADIAANGIVVQMQRITDSIPMAAGNLSASPLSGSEVALTWDDRSDNESGFRTYMRCCGGTYQELGELAADTDSVLVTALDPGTTYDFQVVAFWRSQWEGQSWVFGPDSNPEASAATLAAIGVRGISPAGGPVGTVVEIDGWGLSDPTSVTVSGHDATPFTLVGSNDSTLLLAVPNAGAEGGHEIEVTTSLGTADPVTWSQMGDVDDTEPNDTPEEATGVPVPVRAVQSFNGTDRQDLYDFTLTDTATVTAALIWNTANDLDVIVQPAETAAAFEGDGQTAFENDVCGATGATADPSEYAVCTDLPPGDYVLHVIDFDYFASGDLKVKSYYVALELAN